MPLHEAIDGLQYHASRTSPQFNLRNLEVIELLVEAGADVNSAGGIINFYRNPKHGSPLILVGAEIVLHIINRRMWYEKAVDIFVSAGAFVNLQERDSYGLTILHHAAYMGSHKAIKQIIKRFEAQTNTNIDATLIDTKDSHPESHESMIVMVAGLVNQYPPVALPFASTAFLFAWIELMLVVGRILTWGHYIHMYTIVLWNVSKALSTYVFLIIGFTFSFAILLRGNPGFSNPWAGFLRTVVMMTGEYDAGTMFSTDENDTLLTNVNSENNKEVFLLIISTVIFLLFVILAGIVLMNLITGLAVAEVRGLVKKGKLLRLLELARLVAHLEKVQRNSVADLIKTYWRFGQNGKETPPESESESELEDDLEEEKGRQTLLETRIVIHEEKEEHEKKGILHTLLGRKLDTVTELNLSFDTDLPPGISVKLRENVLDLASKNLKKFQHQSSSKNLEANITETVSDPHKEIKESQKNNQQFICDVCKKVQSSRPPTTTNTLPLPHHRKPIKSLE